MSVLPSIRRATRRMLAVPRIRRIALTVAARFPAVKRLGKAMLDDSPQAARRPAADIRPGRFFPDGQGRKLPIVVLVATGLQAGDAERLVHEVEIAQMTTGTFRPLFVVDTSELRPFRDRGYAVEHVMTQEGYAAVNPHDSYVEYLFSRTTAICRAYGAHAVVPLPPGDPTALSRPVLRLIGALPDGR